MSGGKFARKRQRKPLPLRFLALLLLNAVLVALAIVFAVKLHHVTHLLITQSAAEVWKGQSTENFVQVSAFQPVNQPITETDVETFHQTLQRHFQIVTVHFRKISQGSQIYAQKWYILFNQIPGCLQQRTVPTHNQDTLRILRDQTCVCVFIGMYCRSDTMLLNLTFPSF